ncbi:uncharacterized protein A1O9_01730 [Exophiala aquamarina CBS 119918]|uniref:Uncharacterized protein n=1 Tax=Exophiala aquamarina CBS 119918 TaxID=1182545 RepID=A0A072PVJ9_9EURO|nr:uncharacterized protein A1O9_01730 [Exophiala aquamarina CBS 119918]KEF63752.1 hypothetical protein A1O9_01730 [Exophiala aquamarina CBS 119918]
MASANDSGVSRFASSDEPTIAGPFSLFDGSFILEFLEPRPERNASSKYALSRSDWFSTAQSPPLHIHFLQSESLAVLSGQVGTTTTYDLVDTIHTPQNTGEATPYEITPMRPHTFWPHPDATEDTTFLLWAHPSPDDMDQKMDRLFFQNLLLYLSDISNGKEQMSILQIMLMQHVAATAMVIFSGAWFLGPLRWWVPWKLQALGATIAQWRGKKTLMQQYLSKEEWEDVQSRINGHQKTL